VSATEPRPLRLLHFHELDIGPDEVIVRPRSPGLAFAGVLALVFAGLLARDAARGGLPWMVAGGLILALLGMTWMLYRGWRRYHRAGAWLLAVGPERVLIRFRSVVSQHLPAELPQVIELPLDQVLWVRAMKRGMVQRNGNATLRSSYEYLDFRLRGADLRPLQVELMEDQRERGRRWFAQRDPSVAVSWDGVLRVEMSRNGAAAEPGTRDVLKLLAGRVPVEADAEEYVDTQPTTRLSPAAQDAAIRAAGETSLSQALTLASRFFPGTPGRAAAYVQHLIAVPAPAELAGAPAPARAAPADDGPEDDPPKEDEAAAMPAPGLLRPADARPRRADTMVRPRSPAALAWALAFLAVAGWVGWKGCTGTMQAGWAAALGGVPALLGGVVLFSWIQTLMPGAWRMVVGDSGMLIRFREYGMQRRGAGDPQIVELPYAHVASVRQTRQTVAALAAKTSRGSARSYTYLDIRTRGLQLAPLREALERERAMNPGARRYTPPPVSLSGDGVLRVLMVSRDEFTRPRIGEVMALLGRHVTVEAEATEAVDAAGAPALPPAEHEGAVRSLARSGQTLEAVQLARTLYGDTLDQANQRVRRLAADGAAQDGTA
jgi:hypothetical protein